MRLLRAEPIPPPPVTPIARSPAFSWRRSASFSRRPSRLLSNRFSGSRIKATGRPGTDIAMADIYDGYAMCKLASSFIFLVIVAYCFVAWFCFNIFLYFYSTILATSYSFLCARNARGCCFSRKCQTLSSAIHNPLGIVVGRPKLDGASTQGLLLALSTSWQRRGLSLSIFIQKKEYLSILFLVFLRFVSSFL